MSEPTGDACCLVCSARTAEGIRLCTVHANDIERALGDYPSLMHEASMLATGQTNVYRASGGRPENHAAETERWDTEQQQIDARLRSKDGRVALPSTALMVNLDARELLWDAGNTLITWARHLCEARGLDLNEELEKLARI